jgi:hypothetical protein
VLLGVNSLFNFVAGKVNVNTPAQHRMVKLMHIDKTMFTQYLDEYPEFRRFVILRASVRRAYFNYRMRMCAFEAYLKD